MVRLGVIGHGRRISGVIQNCLRAVEPDLRVVGIVDPDEKAARERLADCDRQDVRFYDSIADMVRGARPEGLAIGTRCNLHAPYASEAAAYDIPLYLEKPVATSMEQALGLEKAFEKSRCPVVVSFPLRVSPLCRLARRYVEEDRLGRPEHVLGINYVPYGTVYFDDQYRQFEVTRGLFLQKATHDLDAMMFLMGSPIRRVAAMHTRGRVFGGDRPAGLVCSACAERDACPESPRNRKRNASGGALEDHPCVFSRDIGSPQTGMNEDSSSALVEFASGAHGAYTQVFFSRRDAAARGATVSGYRGTLSFDWYKNEMSYVRHHEPFSDKVRAGEGLSHFGGDLELACDFLAVIAGTGASRTTIRAGLQSVYACLAAQESAETRRFVDVRQAEGWS
jgi:predicted dehydrogenase